MSTPDTPTSVPSELPRSGTATKHEGSPEMKRALDYLLNRAAPASQGAETPPRFECDGPDWCGVCDLCAERAMQEADERAAAVSREDGGDERVREIEARVNAATEGPWLTDGSDPHYARKVYCDDATGSMVADCMGRFTARPLEEEDSNAAFIAHARQDIPWLLAQLTASRSRVAALEADAERLRGISEFRRIKIGHFRAAIASLREDVAEWEEEHRKSVAVNARLTQMMGAANLRADALEAAIRRMPEPSEMEILAAQVGSSRDSVRAATAFIRRFGEWRRETEALIARSAQQEGREPRSPEGDPRDR